MRPSMPRSPPVSSPERGALVHLLLFGRQWSLAWQGDRPYLEVSRNLLVVEGKKILMARCATTERHESEAQRLPWQG